MARACLEAFNSANWAALKQTFAGDSVYEEFGTQRRVEGADAIVELFRAWKTAMPDVKGTVKGTFVRDNTVALEITWHGTHTGVLQTARGPFAATGKSQTTPGIWSIDVHDGKVKSSRQYFDMLTFLQQIGAPV